MRAPQNLRAAYGLFRKRLEEKLHRPSEDDEDASEEKEEDDEDDTSTSFVQSGYAHGGAAEDTLSCVPATNTVPLCKDPRRQPCMSPLYYTARIVPSVFQLMENFRGVLDDIVTAHYYMSTPDPDKNTQIEYSEIVTREELGAAAQALFASAQNYF